MNALVQLKKTRPPSLKERAKESTRKWRANVKVQRKLLLMGDSNTRFVKELIEQELGRKIDSVAASGALIADITKQVVKVKGYRNVIAIVGANNRSLWETSDAHSQFYHMLCKISSDRRRRMKVFTTIIPKADAYEGLAAEKNGNAILVNTVVRKEMRQTAILLHGALAIQPHINRNSYEEGDNLHVNKKFADEILRMMSKERIFDGASLPLEIGA